MHSQDEKVTAESTEHYIKKRKTGLYCLHQMCPYTSYSLRCVSSKKRLCLIHLQNCFFDDTQEERNLILGTELMEFCACYLYVGAQQRVSPFCIVFD